MVVWKASWEARHEHPWAVARYEGGEEGASRWFPCWEGGTFEWEVDGIAVDGKYCVDRNSVERVFSRIVAWEVFAR